MGTLVLTWRRSEGLSRNPWPARRAAVWLEHLASRSLDKGPQLEMSGGRVASTVTIYQ